MLPYIKSYASFYLTPNQESQSSWSYKKEHKSVPKKVSLFDRIREYDNKCTGVRQLFLLWALWAQWKDYNIDEKIILTQIKKPSLKTKIHKRQCRSKGGWHMII